MNRIVPLTTGETYHVFNRGAHKASIFQDDGGRQRFQALLLVSNRRESLHLANLLTKYKGPTFINLFGEEVADEQDQVVDVLAYCLMPNHFHLVLRQKVDGGITAFMRKVATAYSMYFNVRHGHSGTLWQGRFKSSHVEDDDYLGWLYQYVHLNPLDLIEPAWKERGIKDRSRAEKYIRNYRWSSHFDYAVGKRPERTILAMDDEYDDIDFSDAARFVREQPEIIKDRPL